MNALFAVMAETDRDLPGLLFPVAVLVGILVAIHTANSSKEAERRIRRFAEELQGSFALQTTVSSGRSVS